ncbi:hypothetical protein [Microbacterium lacticum]
MTSTSDHSSWEVNVDTPSDLVARTTRLARLLAIAAGVVFAWVLLTLALSAGTAHAADDDDSGVLGNTLGALAGTVGSVTTPVLEPVAKIAAPVTDALKPVTDAVAPVVEAAAPVAAPVIDPVIEALTPVLQPVLEPVATVVAPLAPVLTPVTEVVEPVLPIDELLPEIGSTITAPKPSGPTDTAGTGGRADGGTLVSAAAAQPSISAGARVVWQMVPVVTAASIASATTATTVGAGVSTLASTLSLTLLLGGAIDATSFFSSSSTFGFGAAAALAFGLFAMHRAWAWRRGPGDESVPSSPTFGTDVSPD